MRKRDLRRFLHIALVVCVWIAWARGVVPTQTARGDQPGPKAGTPGRDSAENGLRSFVTVKLGLPSLGAEEAETLVTLPIESRLRRRQEVQSIRSMSSQGESIIWVGLDAKASASLSNRYAVREAVADELRSEFKRVAGRGSAYLAPEVAGEIILVGLRSRDGQASPQELRAVAEYRLRRELLTVPGVADVMLTGGKVEQVRILADPDRLRAYDVTYLEVIRALEQAADEGAKPAVPPGATPPAAPRPALAARDLGEVIVATRNARVVRLRDVAAVQVAASTPEVVLDPETQKVIPGEPAVILAVCRGPGVDASRWQREVNSRLDGLMPSLPQNMALQRKVPKELAGLLDWTVSKIRRDLPPEWTVEQVAAEGQVTALAPKLRPQRVVRLLGPDRAPLAEAAKGLSDRLRAVPGVTEVHLEPDGLVSAPEFRIDRNRAAQYSVRIADISDTIVAVRGGRIVGRVEGPAGGKSMEIVATSPGPRDRALADVASIQVRGASGEVLPLASLVAVHERTSPRALYREDGHPAVLVFFAINANDEARTRPEVQEAVLATERRLRESLGEFRVRFD